MLKLTKEDKTKIQEKFEYINLDIEEIPSFLKEYEPLEFKGSRFYDENKYKIYKYISVKDIQILLTPTDRLAPAGEKYNLASPLYRYLNSKNKEDIEKYATFLHLINNIEIDDIKKIEDLQENLNKAIPFGVNYNDNYIWQIYYSVVSDKYFMMLSTKENGFAELLYLLKKQIECYKNNTDYKIYVPVKYIEYSGEYLKRSEITDLENYLWLFTKEWPNIYEVYDKNNELSLQIVGDTVVYDSIQSKYKITLNNKEEAQKLYKLIKALFILQTETDTIYKFEVKINNFGSIDFFYNSININFDNLTDFIQNQYLNTRDQALRQEKEKIIEEKRLVKLKELSILKDQEYYEKERQITTFLECKKTFFGKVKYYIKYTKKKKDNNNVVKKIKNMKSKDEFIKEDLQEEKELYTLEDLIVLTEKFNKISKELKNLNMDIKAINKRIEMMDNKIDNAGLYIEEIENHAKSIFEFWRFTNKNENLKLTEAEEQEESTNELKKFFDYKEDLEELGKEADKKQRNNLQKEECDSIFLTTTNILQDLNTLNNCDIDEEIVKIRLKNSLEALLQEAQESKTLFNVEDFDIFGGIIEDKTKTNILGNIKHRETLKNKFKILDLNKNTDLEDYTETLKKHLTRINETNSKIKSIYDMAIYKSSMEDYIDSENYNICNINPINAIEQYKYQKNKTYLFKLNINEGMNIIYNTNIIYYNNFNKTLPLGMNITDTVLINLNKFNLKETNRVEFKIVEPKYKESMLDINIKDVVLIEYDLTQKEQK